MVNLEEIKYHFQDFAELFSSFLFFSLLNYNGCCDVSCGTAQQIWMEKTSEEEPAGNWKKKKNKQRKPADNRENVSWGKSSHWMDITSQALELRMANVANKNTSDNQFGQPSKSNDHRWRNDSGDSRDFHRMCLEETKTRCSVLRWHRSVELCESVM